jgi:hypothetical protein
MTELLCKQCGHPASSHVSDGGCTILEVRKRLKGGTLIGRPCACLRTTVYDEERSLTEDRRQGAQA